MRKILLVCSAGMSTSLLVNKMKQYAQSIDYEIEVEAHSISHARNIAQHWDIVLLGPQVKFQLQDMKKAFPNKPVDVIDMRVYGRMDGKSVVKQAKNLLND